MFLVLFWSTVYFKLGLVSVLFRNFKRTYLLIFASFLLFAAERAFLAVR